MTRWEYPLANTMPEQHDLGDDLCSSDDNFDAEFDRLGTTQLEQLRNHFTADDNRP